MFQITPYHSSEYEKWNAFVERSKNATFLFDRHYMDYHADRFQDASLMFYLEGRLVALLPAHKDGDTLCSHNGLTYGGLIMDEKATAERISVLFAEMNDYLRNQGFRTVFYKPVPWIYHQYAAEEDLYALYNVCKAQLVGRDVAAVACTNHLLPWRNIRKQGAKKAIQHGCVIREGENYSDFWDILTENLLTKYGVSPVHTLDEIHLLHHLFLKQIRLFVAEINGRVMGGTVLYMTRNVVHVQYISASAEGKRLHVLDCLFDFLLENLPQECHYFDFGKSTATDSCLLNASLAYQKEGFGARSICYDTYQWNL